MINEIISISESVGDEYTHQLSDKDDITSVSLNRCLRFIHDTYASYYAEKSNEILNINEGKDTLLKFRVTPVSGELTSDDCNNMSFGFDDPENPGYHVVDERGNFAEIGDNSVNNVSKLEYVNYPSQVYRSIRMLGSSTSEKALDVTYVDDAVEGGRYYSDPIGLRKASDTTDDAVFGVVGRLWNHSAEISEQTLSATTTDQTLSSGGWMPDAMSVSPVSAYEASTAVSEFAPTVDSLYANEFPFMMFNLMGDPDANSESGTYSVPGYNSIEIDYTSILLNSDIGLTFGAIKIMRGSEDFQEVDLDIDLSSSIISERCPSKLLFSQFGNGVMNGVTAVSYPNSMTGGKARLVNEIIAPTVLQTGDFRFTIKDITKTTYGDVTYFNANTGFKKDEEAISNVRISNRSYEIYYMLMYRVSVWKENTPYSVGDRVWYKTDRYESRENGNVSVPGVNTSWMKL